MLQAILQAPKTIEYREVPMPEPGAGQVVMKVKRIGICGSDIHVYHGSHKYATLPIVQGHEGSGTVEKVGAGVEGLAPGDPVTLRPQHYCGECFLCSQGRYNLCETYRVMGVLGGITGMASEYFVIDATKLHKLPPSMSFDAGAVVEPAAVGVHAVKLGGKAAGSKILVIGAGPIGNLAAQAAKALGADKVMIADISDVRLKLAGDCGIDFCVNTLNTDLEKAILEKFGPNRADFILDCAGSPKTLEQAIRIARHEAAEGRAFRTPKFLDEMREFGAVGEEVRETILSILDELPPEFYEPPFELDEPPGSPFIFDCRCLGCEVYFKFQIKGSAKKPLVLFWSCHAPRGKRK